MIERYFGLLYFVVKKLAKFADCPPNAWNDHEEALRALALRAKTLVARIDEDEEEIHT